MIDYHVHTALCKHADGSMIQYVESACEKGLSEICFLDHLTLHSSGSHLSMTPAELPFYFYSARALADQFKDRIKVKAGLEIDYDPAHAEDIRKIIAPFDFDVLGGSVHFIENVNLVSRYTDEDRALFGIEESSRRYLEKLDTMISADIVDVVCHIDIFKKFGQRPGSWIEDQMNGILSKIKKKNLAVELNTSGLIHPAKEPYPAVNILRQCYMLGIPITYGSDAHTPANVGRDIDTAREMLASVGYTTLAGFTRRKRYDVDLNSVEMPLSNN